MRESNAAQELKPLPEIGPKRPIGFNPRLVLFGALGAVTLGVIGTWLMWYGQHVERQLVLDDIRGACARVMPETIQRCVDTVIIQRGGARR